MTPQGLAAVVLACTASACSAAGFGGAHVRPAFAPTHNVPTSLALRFGTNMQKDRTNRSPLGRAFGERKRVNSLRMQQGSDNKSGGQMFDQAAAFATSAAIAAAAVNQAVSMKALEAPDVEKTYIVKDQARLGLVDSEGLPIVYDKKLIEAYWRKQDGALQKRWREFLAVSVPFLTKLVAMLVRGGTDELKKNQADLARDARINLERLGPTYIKAGQMMSVRPDVLPQEALDELAKLQDAVKPFDTELAVQLIEAELGDKLGAYFTEISDKPVAAASLAQVYKARLTTGEWVAVKIQRPDVLSIVSKDLYVLRRAAEVYQGLMDRFAPQQRTDYVGLLNEWAVGFYTELDFTNEATNQRKLKSLLAEAGNKGVYIPEVYEELCTRRLLVTEWIDGVKLSDCEPDEIKECTDVGQECFLTQLLQIGFFHSDPHPGNIIRMNDQTKGKIALIDFGLVASLQQEDMDNIVSAVIHLANKDYTALVNDFIKLKILPEDCDRAKVVPLMDKALSPYVKGGGAKKYEEELKKIYGVDESAGSKVGAFQAMTNDALTVLNDIPFSIPPYFALIARAVVTLEGVALIGNPDYGLILEAYPFVARKLLREDRPEIQRALQEVLYADGGIQGQRLANLLNGALGVVAKTQGGVFVDLDSMPEDGIALEAALSYLMSEKATSLRNILLEEAITAGDILLRQSARKGFGAFLNSLPRPPFGMARFLPKPETVPTPFLVPTASGNPAPVLIRPQELIDRIAPELTREEELYALSIVDLASGSLGRDAGTVVGGDAFLEPRAAARLLLSVLTSGKAPGLDALPPAFRQTSERMLVSLGGNVPTSKTAGDDNGELNDALSAVANLSPEARTTLEQSGEYVLRSLWNKHLERLADIAGVPPPRPENAPKPPVVKTEAMKETRRSTGTLVRRSKNEAGDEELTPVVQNVRDSSRSPSPEPVRERSEASEDDEELRTPVLSKLGAKKAVSEDKDRETVTV